MTLQFEMVGEMIHIKCEGGQGQFYAPLSQDEYEMVCMSRVMKDIEPIVNEQNEKSSNQRAVEDIERLNKYMKDTGLYEIGVDYIIECHTRQKKVLAEYRINNNLNGYQTKAAETAIYPGKGTPLGLIYCALKLSGESGEVAENVGKALRDDGLYFETDMEGGGFSQLTKERANKLVLELGDVLWYVSQAAKELGFSLEEIAQANLEKLANRAKNDTLKGSGDDR